MSRKASKVFQQSGVIPYRINNDKIEVLLISIRKRQRWAIPKGGISKAIPISIANAVEPTGSSCSCYQSRRY